MWDYCKIENCLRNDVGKADFFWTQNVLILKPSDQNLVSTTCPFVWLGSMKEILVKQSWRTKFGLINIEQNNRDVSRTFEQDSTLIDQDEKNKQKTEIDCNLRKFTYPLMILAKFHNEGDVPFERRMMRITCYFEWGDNPACLVERRTTQLKLNMSFDGRWQPIVSHWKEDAPTWT